MQGMNEITMGLTPQERDTYLAHQRMRARQEVERQESLIQDRKAYKARLVERILTARPNVWTREFLAARSLNYLERIDY